MEKTKGEKNIKGVEPKLEGFLGLVGVVRVVIILNSGSLIPGPLLFRRRQQAPSLLLLLQRQSLCLCLCLDLSRGLDLGLQLRLELQLLLHGHHGHGLRLLEQSLLLLLLDNHLLREGKVGEHMAVSELEQRVADPLELIDLDVQFKLGSEQKLEFELVQFWKCQTSNLIDRIEKEEG